MDTSLPAEGPTPRQRLSSLLDDLQGEQSSAIEDLGREHPGFLAPLKTQIGYALEAAKLEGAGSMLRRIIDEATQDGLIEGDLQ